MTNDAEENPLSGLENTFAVEEVQKSNLLLEAQLLRAAGQTDAAAVRFAQAAKFEEHLAEGWLAQGEKNRAFAHCFSAVGCWAQAGNWHAAITLGEQLLTQTELSEGMRQRVLAYLHLLRQRRAAWSADLVLADIGQG